MPWFSVNQEPFSSHIRHYILRVIEFGKSTGKDRITWRRWLIDLKLPELAHDQRVRSVKRRAPELVYEWVRFRL